MTNTLEKKLRFFALYFGQEVHRGNRSKHLDHLSIMRNQKFGHLELKSLSDISDEDAIEVAKICNHPSGVTWNIKEQGYFAIYNKYNDHADKKETLRIYYRNSFEIFSLDEYGRVFDYDLERLLNICDYLRSKGYLLPFMDLSIEQILEYKWAVIK